MLGKLSRELRILGLDVDYSRGMSGMRAYHRARGRGRALVTRNTRLRNMQGILFIQTTDLHEQMAEVGRQLNIQQLIDAGTKEDKAFSRCIKCNAQLEKITRDQARPSVPFFIYQIHHDFRRCPQCKRVYWPGSHKNNMVQQRVQPRQKPAPKPQRQPEARPAVKDSGKPGPDQQKGVEPGASQPPRQRRGRPRRRRPRRKPDSPNKT
jgi:uncharacterized protein with PIN domain